MKKHGAKWAPNYFLLLPGHPLIEKNSDTLSISGSSSSYLEG